jgi:hypothetical protein
VLQFRYAKVRWFPIGSIVVWSVFRLWGGWGRLQPQAMTEATRVAGGADGGALSETVLEKNIGNVPLNF